MNKRPLEGIKILDFSQVLSAPFCGMMLADMGAEIVKVERPGLGDISREYGPYKKDANNGKDTSLYFCQYNRGKKGIAVDMRSEEGKKVIMDLVASVDVVVENFKSGSLEKLGLGYDEMIKVNPGLIYGSISGFGTYGPLSHLPCMDIIAAARSGLVAQTGQDGDAPIKPGFSMCDTWAGLQLFRGLAMALLQKQKTGKGLRVDIAMLDCAFYMCEGSVIEYSLTGKFTPKSGNHYYWYAPCGEFQAADGNVVIDVKSNVEFVKMCKALGMLDVMDDNRFGTNELRVHNKAALIEEINKVTSVKGRYETEKILSDAGVAAAAVQTLAEFDKNPLTKELKVITQIHQPGIGEYTVTNTPVHFSKTPVDPDHAAPGVPGANSVEVLQNLGYSQEKIDELLASGAVAQPV